MNNILKYKSATIGALLFITIILMVVISPINNNNSSKEYKDIYELMGSSHLCADIPQYIIDNCDENTVYKNISNYMVMVYNNSFTFKSSDFVDINADPLAIYEESLVDNKYNDSNITYFRFRQGNNEAGVDSTIINWCTEDVSYGLIINESIPEEFALSILGINFDNLSIIGNEHIDDVDTKLEEYKFNEHITMKVPVFSSRIQSLEINGATTLFIEHELVAVIVYNDYDLMAGTYDDMESILRDDGIKLYYNIENPFDHNSVTYQDYELFISTIEDICKSIVYSKN